MGLLVLTLPTITREPRVAQHAAANRWLGFGALFSLRYVPALTLLSLVFFFSYGPLEAALPVYSVQTLHANADGYGLLWTGFGAGAFAGVLTLTKLSRRWRPSIALPMIDAGDRYLWPRLHPRRAGWPRLPVTASVATRKLLVFRQGMNAEKEIWTT